MRGFNIIVAANAAIGGWIGAALVVWAVTKSGCPDYFKWYSGRSLCHYRFMCFCETLAAVIIGLMDGLIVFFSIRFSDKAKIDDPIFALSVHGVVGVWGTMSDGLFVHLN